MLEGGQAMLFSTRNSDFESEKERNLYYKFFAGYFFNELIPDLDARIGSFCTLLNDCTRGGKSIRPGVRLTPDSTHVSFDNHGYLFSGIGLDRGEFADVLIQDHSTRVMVAIEAKVQSNWSYNKDIASNEKRLKLIENEIPNLTMFPCLLLTESKWKASARQKSRQHSNYQRLVESDGCRTRVVFWEELLAITNDIKVRAYIEDQLARSHRSRYAFEGGWFKQGLPN